MAFRALGSVGIDGEPTLRPQAARILALLLVRRGHWVALETIEEAVWAGELRERGAIHTAMSRLRSRLPESTLSQSAGGYRLDTSGVGFDVDLFETQLKLGEQAERPGERLVAIEAALHWWRGAPYGPFGLDPFQVAETVRLSDRHARAEELRAEALVDLARPGDAVAALATPLAQHPFHEGLRVLHVRSLAAAGRRVEALRELDAYRRRLAEETGLSPSAPLLRLERELLDEEPGASLTPGPRPATQLVVPKAEPPASATSPAAHFPVVQAPFGIRRHERSRLHSVVAEVVAGSPRLVVLSGEPGTGKTFLAEELRDVARASGMRVVSGRADAAASIPLGMWGTLGRDARREAADSGLSSRRSLLVGSVVAAVESALRVGGLGVILEDCHWADAASLEAVSSVQALVDGGTDPLLVVMTTRTAGLDDVTRPELARLVRDRTTVAVELGALDVADVDELAAQELGGRVAPQLLHELERLSNGSPLLVRLLCERLRAQQLLRLGPHGWSCDVVDVSLPADLRSPYALLFRELSVHAADLVVAAALIGQSVSLDLLARVIARPIEEAAADAAEAERVGLFRSSSPIVAFDHDVARRAVLGELRGGERQARHLLIAERLLEDHRDHSVGSVGSVGGPADLASALVPLIGTQLQQAGLLAPRSTLIDWSIAAGDQAVQDSLHSEAARHYRAAAAAGADGVELRLGLAEYYALDPQAAASLVVAADRANTSGELDTEIDATLQLHRHEVNRGVSTAESDRRLDALLARDLSRLQRLRILAMRCEYSIERRGHQPDLLAEVEALLQPDDPEPIRFDVLTGAGLALMDSLRFDEALDRFSAADNVVYPARVGEPRTRIAIVQLVRGCYADCLATLDRRLEESLRSRRFFGELATLLAVRSNAQFLLGDEESGARTLEDADRWARTASSSAARLHVALQTAARPRARRSGWSAGMWPLDVVADLVDRDTLGTVHPDAGGVCARLERRCRAMSFRSLIWIGPWAAAAAVRGTSDERAAVCAQIDVFARRGVVAPFGWPLSLEELRRQLSLSSGMR